MNVLSLCDGMSCCRIALERAGINVDSYYAAEIKPHAIKCTKSNYPDTVFIGDVNNVSYRNGVLHTENGNFEIDFDLVAFGSPCQSFSIAMKSDMRVGLEDKKRSGLFYECNRILNEVNPRYFLVENVASMSDDNRDILTGMLGVKPIMIDSSILCAGLRKRYYWTNIPVCGTLEKRDVCLSDILDYGYTDREKARSLMASNNTYMHSPAKEFRRYCVKNFDNIVFLSKEHYDNCVSTFRKFYENIAPEDIPSGDVYPFTGIRRLNKRERERIQTVPEGYTDCVTDNQAANLLGDGWTIDVVAWIFSFINYKEV